MMTTKILSGGSKRLLAVLVAAGLGGLVMGSVGTAAPPAGKRLNDGAKAHGLTVRNGAEHKQKTGPNGKVTITDSPSVTVKGFGKRTLTTVIEDEPIAAGGVQRATITDPKTKTTTVFSYNPSTNSITIADGASSVVVVQNPDHSYSVDGVAAANGRAAVDLIRGKPAYQSASPHSLMLAYSHAHAPNQAAKSNPECGGGATPPAVCVLFSDFCECAACDKTGKRNACASCE
jgi:hypothetical protein